MAKRFEKRHLIRKTVLRGLIAMALAASLGWALPGCSGQRETLRLQADLYWPPPPEKTRIRFVTAVSKPEDLNIGADKWTRFFNYLFGIPPVAIGSPYGMASDEADRLFVVDTYLKKVHVFDRRDNAYMSFPEDRPLFDGPVDIAIDADNYIYVTDAERGVVDIFKDGGDVFIEELGRDIFKRPTGIAVNRSTSQLLVVDTLRASVFRFDLKSRTLLGSFGESGKADGRFHYPTQICVSSAGNIIVSDSLNFRIQVFSPAGRFLRAFGRMGRVPGTFSRPKGVAADSDGNIYVVDALFDNIQVFDPMGRLLLAFGGHGTGYGDFWLPTAIYIDADDRIYVSDSSNKRVQIFKYLKEKKTQ